MKSVFEAVMIVAAVLGITDVIYRCWMAAYRRWQKVCTMHDVMDGLRELEGKIRQSDDTFDVVVGIGRGGSVVAGIMAHLLKDRDPIEMINWGWTGHGKDRKILIHSNYDFTGKNVLITMAEDFHGHSLNKAKELLKRDDDEMGSPESVKTLSFYVLNVEHRKDVKEYHDGAHFCPLPDYYAKDFASIRSMPWY